MKKRNFNVTTAFSGQEGIQALRKVDFDAALLDLKMDDMDGLEVLEKIFEEEGDAQVIMISGHGNIETAVTAIKRVGLRSAPHRVVARPAGDRDGRAGQNDPVVAAARHDGLEAVDPVVERPPKELKGFAKVFLEPGGQERVTIELDRRSFAYYDVEAGDWTVTAGAFEILIGQSSREIELEGVVQYE